jgi:hypothetical protein
MRLALHRSSQAGTLPRLPALTLARAVPVCEALGGPRAAAAGRCLNTRALVSDRPAHVQALLVRQSLLPGVMRERDWQRLYKCGVRPEDAGAQVAHYNTRPALGRVSKR